MHSGDETQKLSAELVQAVVSHCQCKRITSYTTQYYSGIGLKKEHNYTFTASPGSKYFSRPRIKLEDAMQHAIQYYNI